MQKFTSDTASFDLFDEKVNLTLRMQDDMLRHQWIMHVSKRGANDRPTWPAGREEDP